MQGKIPKIEKPEFYLDFAFNRATKHGLTIKSKTKKKGVDKFKEVEKEKIREISIQLNQKLETIVKKYPNGQKTHQFYIELMKTLTDLSELNKSIESLGWAIKKITKLTSEHLKKMNTSTTKITIVKHKNTYYGRVSSVMKKIRGHLSNLE